MIALLEIPPICPMLTLAHSGQYSQLSLGGGGGGELLQPKVTDHKRLKISRFALILSALMTNNCFYLSIFCVYVLMK